MIDMVAASHSNSSNLKKATRKSVAFFFARAF